MVRHKDNNKSGIALPPSSGLLGIVPDKKDINIAQEQLGKGAQDYSMNAEMQKFVNQVASQAKPGKQVRVNEKVSNGTYASMPLAVERKDLKASSEILAQLPRSVGRKRPDFSIGDYIRLAIKNQVKKDQKIIKKGGKISHSRR